MAKDILLDENNEIQIINGDFSIGESELQEVASVLRLRQGELKSDPILGANLQHFMKGKYDRTAIEKRVKIHLERDGKNYDQIKKNINLNISNG
ncbi:MAG: hypothetical protein QM564_11710 [Bergeyella sp.]